MAPMGTRESLVPSDMQLIVAPQQINYDFEELKRTYGTQNNVLAKQNEELRMKISNLEKQLFSTQKELLQLRNERAYLREKLQSNSKRFNNVIVNSFEAMMGEYREFMSDLKVDVEGKDVSELLRRKVNVNEEAVKAEVQNFDQYWKQVNSNLQRRKSLIRQPVCEPEKTTDDLDTLVENEDEEMEVETGVARAVVETDKTAHVPVERIAPPYEDVDSSFVPTKHNTIEMVKVDENPLEDVPLLSLEAEKLDDQNVDNHEVKDDNNNDELFNYDVASTAVSPEASPVKSQPEVLNDVSDHSPVKDVKLTKKVVRPRKSKVPRELKNLDPEKTRRWTGVDPFDDDFDSTSDRRKSRRRSLVVNYQLPVMKVRNKRGREKMTIFIDDSDSDKENRVSKCANVKKGSVLKNITNIQKRDGETKGKSIFDLENTDMFSSYDKSKNRRSELENRYDMLL